MAPESSSPLNWEGQTALDRGGEKIGTIEEVFLVADTGRPEWGLVKIGRIKSYATLVPLIKAQPVDKGVKLAYEKQLVEDAPRIDATGEPSDQQVDEVYRHYGIDPNDGQSANGASQAVTAAPTSRPDVVNGSGADLRQEPIGDLVKQVQDEASTLVKNELKLAKAELTEKAKEIGVGAGMFGGAGLLAALASLAFMLCLIFALGTFMPDWLAALIVTVVFLAAAGGLALAGKARIKKAGPPVPEQTVESVKQTIQTVKEDAKWGLNQTS